jgi:hypothetical protein
MLSSATATGLLLRTFKLARFFPFSLFLLASQAPRETNFEISKIQMERIVLNVGGRWNHVL